MSRASSLPGPRRSECEASAHPVPAALSHQIPCYLRRHLIKKCLSYCVSVLFVALLGSNKGPELSLVLWGCGRHPLWPFPPEASMNTDFCVIHLPQTKEGLGPRDLRQHLLCARRLLVPWSTQQQVLLSCWQVTLLMAQTRGEGGMGNEETEVELARGRVTTQAQTKPQGSENKHQLPHSWALCRSLPFPPPHT